MVSVFHLPKVHSVLFMVILWESLLLVIPFQIPLFLSTHVSLYPFGLSSSLWERQEGRGNKGEAVAKDGNKVIGKGRNDPLGCYSI